MSLVTNHDLFMNHWYYFVKNLAALQKHTAEEESKPGTRAQYIEIISINFQGALNIALSSVETNDPYSQDFKRWLIAQRAVLTDMLTDMLNDLNIDKGTRLSLLERLEAAAGGNTFGQSFITNEAQFIHVLRSIINKANKSQKVLEHVVGLFRTLLNELAEHYDWYLNYEGKIACWHAELVKIVGGYPSAEILQNDWNLFNARVDLEKQAIDKQKINIEAMIDQITEINSRTLLQNVRAELAEALGRLRQLLSRSIDGAFKVGEFAIANPRQTLKNLGYTIRHLRSTGKAIVRYCREHPLKCIAISVGIVVIPLCTVGVCIGMPFLIPAEAILVAVTGVAIAGGVAEVMVGTSVAASSGNAARALVAYEEEKKITKRRAEEREELIQSMAERTRTSMHDLRERLEASRRAEREVRMQQIARDQLLEFERIKRDNYHNLEQKLNQGDVSKEGLERTVQELETKIAEVDAGIIEEDEAIRTCEKAYKVGEAELGEINACQRELKKFNDMYNKLYSSGIAKSAGAFFSIPSFISRQTASVKIDGLSYHPIPGDGNCMYRAVAYYLCNGEDIKFLRSIVAANLESNSALYAGFIPLHMNDTLPAYIARVRSTNEWGGELEINILMKLLDRPIVILGPNERILNEEAINLYAGKDPIFVYYDEINHYDAIIVQDGYNSKDILENLLTPNHSANCFSPQLVMQ